MTTALITLLALVAFTIAMGKPVTFGTVLAYCIGIALGALLVAGCKALWRFARGD